MLIKQQFCLLQLYFSWDSYSQLLLAVHDMHVCENWPLTTANLAWKVNIDTIGIQFHNPLHGDFFTTKNTKEITTQGNLTNVCYSGVSEVNI